MQASCTVQTPPLGIEIRAALDLIATWARQTDPPRVRLVGRSDLIDELGRYLPLPEDPRAPILIALGASPSVLHENLAASAPTHVIVLAAGSLARAVRRLRTYPISVEPDLPASIWRACGYRMAESQGVQGAGSLVWAGANLLAERWDRSALADRCRIAMLRTLLTSRATPWLGTLAIRAYRKCGGV